MTIIEVILNYLRPMFLQYHFNLNTVVHKYLYIRGGIRLVVAIEWVVGNDDITIDSSYDDICKNVTNIIKTWL